MKGIKKNVKKNNKALKLNKKRKRKQTKAQKNQNNKIMMKEKERVLKNNKKIMNSSNPIHLSYFDIKFNNSYAAMNTNNTFIVFNSIDNILIIIYRTEENSIIAYDLINNKKIIEIKKAHEEEIINFRHFYDAINKRDIILSISKDDDNIKLWNPANWECINNILGIYRSGVLTSACLFEENNQNYILTSTDANSNLIKIIDFDGKKIKFLNDSKDKTYYIDYYYDNNLYKPFVVTGNDRYIKSFDYNLNKVYHTYYDKNHDNFEHDRIIVYNSGDITKIIECTLINGINIWDFHSGKLLTNIFDPLGYGGKYDICLWNHEYLFVGVGNKIKLLEIKKQKIIKELIGHKENPITIKTFLHPKYGECLISQGLHNDRIILWINKNINKKLFT